MKTWWYFLIVPLGLLFCLFFVRLILPSQIDDVSPGIFCEESLLEKADVYYVIPKFENVSINSSWCDYILGFDKELAMHGVYHELNEFGVVRDFEYVGEGIEIFERCFGFVPERFKPPQLVWTDENDWMRDSLEVDLFWNQLFHKVYHCGDAGIYPNWFIDIF